MLLNFLKFDSKNINDQKSKKITPAVFFKRCWWCFLFCFDNLHVFDQTWKSLHGIIFQHLQKYH